MDNGSKEVMPKGFVVMKNINPPAKIIGLFYNTFFVWVLFAVIVFLLCSSKGFIASIGGAVFIFMIYIFLFFFQTKFGPKKVLKHFNYFMQPIDYLKMKKSPKR